MYIECHVCGEEYRATSDGYCSICGARDRKADISDED